MCLIWFIRCVNTSKYYMSDTLTGLFQFSFSRGYKYYVGKTSVSNGNQHNTGWRACGLWVNLLAALSLSHTHTHKHNCDDRILIGHIKPQRLTTQTTTAQWFSSFHFGLKFVSIQYFPVLSSQKIVWTPHSHVISVHEHMEPINNKQTHTKAYKLMLSKCWVTHEGRVRRIYWPHIHTTHSTTSHTPGFQWAHFHRDHLVKNPIYKNRLWRLS